LKLFFDSSVLVPVFYADHEHHIPSKKLFLNAGKEDFCARRSLCEVYATLSGLPLRPRITGPQAMEMVRKINERLTLISLDDSEYFYALEVASSQAVVGNTAYDALIASCAIKAGATILLTWNTRHFSRLGDDISRIIKTPLDL
jgi:predicted nucleic acid-binding protein